MIPSGGETKGIPSYWYVYRNAKALKKYECEWSRSEREKACKWMWQKYGDRLKEPLNDLRSPNRADACKEDAAFTWEVGKAVQVGVVGQYIHTEAIGIGITKGGHAFCYAGSGHGGGIELTAGFEVDGTVAVTVYDDYRDIPGLSTVSGHEFGADVDIYASFGFEVFGFSVKSRPGGVAVGTGQGASWTGGAGIGVGFFAYAWVKAESSPLVCLSSQDASRLQSWVPANTHTLSTGDLLSGEEPGECSRNCFDAATELLTPTGSVRADNVSVGDEVLVAASDGSLIHDRIAFVVQHTNATDVEYISIATGSRTITLSSGHYLHSIQAGSKSVCCTGSTLKAAKDVSIGDTVWVTSESGSRLNAEVVLNITTHRSPGAYNFLLLQRDATSFHSVIADGVAASSFTKEWRLIDESDPWSFDVADSMASLLRESYEAWIAFNNRASSIDSISLIQLALDVQDIVADCVESALAECSEEVVSKQLEDVIGSALRSQEGHGGTTDQNQDQRNGLSITPLVPPDLVVKVLEVLQGLATRHAPGMFIPQWVQKTSRRLLMEVSTSDLLAETLASFTISAVSRALVDDAVNVCHKSERCTHKVEQTWGTEPQKMRETLYKSTPPGHILIPIWMLPLLLVVLVLSSLAATVTATVCCLKRALKKASKSQASPTPAMPEPPPGHTEV